jgi:hypothetical protein
MVAKKDSATALSQQALAADGQAHAELVGQLGVLRARILAATVAVEDHRAGGATGRDGVGQGLGDQVGAQVVGGGPAHDAA